MIGPLLRNPPWQFLKPCTAHALKAVCILAQPEALRLLSATLGSFFEIAAIDVADATGAPRGKKHIRGKAIRCKWRPLFQCDKKKTCLPGVAEPSPEDTFIGEARLLLDNCLLFQEAAAAETHDAQQATLLSLGKTPDDTTDDRVKHIWKDLDTYATGARSSIN